MVRLTEYCTSCVTCSYLMQEFLSSFLHVLPCSQDSQINCNLKVALSPLLSSPPIWLTSLHQSFSHLFVVVKVFLCSSSHLIISVWHHATTNDFIPNKYTYILRIKLNEYVVASPFFICCGSALISQLLVLVCQRIFHVSACLSHLSCL